MAPGRESLLSAGLLVLRVGMGGLMLVRHGWPKLAAFAERSATFPDPLGVGSALSLSMTIAAEVGCALLVAIGLLTRAACGPLIFLLLVAGFVIHADDPFAKKEMAFVYLTAFTALLLTGPGRYSCDRLLSGRKRR